MFCTGCGKPAVGNFCCHCGVKCQPTPNTSPGTSSGSVSSDDRRQKLLKMMMSSTQSKTEKMGRPLKSSRVVQFGLYVASASEKSKLTLVKSPLGDKNFIQLTCGTQDSYHDILQQVKAALFPKGLNIMIGNVNCYNLTLTDITGRSVEDAVDGVFSLRKYLDAKLIPGQIRLFCKCIPVNDEESDSDSNSDIEVMKTRYPFSSAMTDEEDLNGSSADITTSKGDTIRKTVEAASEIQNEDTIRKAVEGASDIQMDYCLSKEEMEDFIFNMKNEINPVIVLKSYRIMILKGDEMNNMDDNGFDRGKETDALICVTRLTGDDGKIIFDDFDEQVRTWPPTHFRQRIEVMYDGENAKDLGGPRRELLTDLIRYIKGDDSPFLNVINNECWISTSEREHIGYFAAGVAVAMALLFEGPPVNFLAEGQMDRLLNKESLELNGGEREFSRGMNMYGVLELVRKKPVMRYLLRPGTQAVMTMRKLKSLVKPVFSEAGTNSKIKEEKIFRMFNKYLIEVQHGNRPVDIPMILKFITGSETEPITGFDPGLTIEFYDNNDDIPTSSTCTNTFRLPYYDGIKQDSVFAKFDYAFSNKYFGKH